MHKYIDKQLISCNSFSSDSCWGIFVLPFLCFWGASRQPTHVFVCQTVAKRLETSQTIVLDSRLGGRFILSSNASDKRLVPEWFWRNSATS